jgi:hypothetical protein
LISSLAERSEEKQKPAVPVWFTPGSTALRSTVIAWSRLPGIASGANAAPRWGKRITPNPIRLTVRSPSVQVPAAAAPHIYADARPGRQRWPDGPDDGSRCRVAGLVLRLRSLG